MFILRNTFGGLESGRGLSESGRWMLGFAMGSTVGGGLDGEAGWMEGLGLGG